MWVHLLLHDYVKCVLIKSLICRLILLYERKIFFLSVCVCVGYDEFLLFDATELAIYID